jgi:trehalose-phosphatase
MSLPLHEHLAEIAGRVTAAAHLLLGLDDRGSLMLIEDTPYVTPFTLAEETRDALTALAAQTITSTAIVSGRRLQDLEALIGIDGLIYVGNQGLDISGPGIRFTEPTAAEVQRTLGWLAIVLAKGLAQISGVVVENKGLTMSVHYRHVDRSKVDEVHRHVRAAAAVTPDYFRVLQGDRILEVQPDVVWHKGTAMRWIAAQLAKPDTLILYMGRDVSDEDAFQALADGITIKVGEPGFTSAHYHVESPAAVREFLDWLAQLRQAKAICAPEKQAV